MGALDGKIAVITGGGTGIGFAIAERFAREGAEVVIAGRRKERLDSAAAQIGHSLTSTEAGPPSEPHGVGMCVRRPEGRCGPSAR